MDCCWTDCGFVFIYRFVDFVLLLWYEFHNALICPHNNVPFHGILCMILLPLDERCGLCVWVDDCFLCYCVVEFVSWYGLLGLTWYFIGKYCNFLVWVTA